MARTAFRKFWVGVGLACAFTSSCSSSAALCGQSFCFSNGPKILSKSTQVDFVVYDIGYVGQRYVIYEGNYPATRRGKNLGTMRPDDVPKGFVEGTWYERKPGYQVVFRTVNRRWPTFVAVSTETDDPKALDVLLPTLSGKASSEG
jgi:hypothetical protein